MRVVAPRSTDRPTYARKILVEIFIVGSRTDRHLLQAVFLRFIMNRFQRQAEDLRRLGLVPARHLERPPDQLLLHLRGARAERDREGRSALGWTRPGGCVIAR